MSRRKSRILWLKDLIEHLQMSQEELEWTQDPEMIRVISESMLRDLDSCRRLCEEIHRKVSLRQAV